MNLYIIRHGSDEGVFEYKKFIEASSLRIINSELKIGVSLGSSDMELLRSCGGTVLYKENNTWIIHYLIDLDFKGKSDYVDDDWKSKIGALILSVRRDMQLSDLVG